MSSTLLGNCTAILAEGKEALTVSLSSVGNMI